MGSNQINDSAVKFRMSCTPKPTQTCSSISEALELISQERKSVFTLKDKAYKRANLKKHAFMQGKKAAKRQRAVAKNSHEYLLRLLDDMASMVIDTQKKEDSSKLDILAEAAVEQEITWSKACRAANAPKSSVHI